MKKVVDKPELKYLEIDEKKNIESLKDGDSLKSPLALELLIEILKEINKLRNKYKKILEEEKKKSKQK